MYAPFAYLFHALLFFFRDRIVRCNVANDCFAQIMD